MRRAALLALCAPLLLGVLTATAPASAQPPSGPVQEEVPSTTGAANPLDAPLLQAGTVVDTILQSEVLWYAVDAAPGQAVEATVQIVGRPDGPSADDTILAASLTDPQRQPLVEDEVDFDGQADASVALTAVTIPAVGGDQPLLSVALRSQEGAASLEGTGYRLQLTVAVQGDPLPPAETAPPVTAAPDEGPASEPAPAVTSPPAPPPGAPDVVGDVLPFALVALAVGGFAGFELSRRGR